jgi:N-acetylmuramoyl-L-alanine amidase
MALMRFLAALLLLLLLPALPADAQSPRAAVRPETQSRPLPRVPVATQVVVNPAGRGIDVLVDMSEEVRASVSAIAAPDRLLLDFRRLVFLSGQPAAMPADAPVRGYRFGAVFAGQSRIVLDLAEPMTVVEQRFLPLRAGGKRLVIRLEPAERPAFEALVARRETADGDVTGTTPATAVRPADERPLVVLDPGHGGVDPGASGPGGELEKTIVLDFAVALKAALERSGKVRVMLTRSDDTFVPLRDRVRAARAAKAAVFLSIHADSLADEADVRGATVYTLAEKATDERTRKLAERENRADLAAGLEVREDQEEVADILFDLARRETRVFSHQMARTLVATLPKATRLHRNPHRGAGFRVLRAPDVPSVLLELGYLSSAEEARMMAGEEWRLATAGATAEAVERFVQETVSRAPGRLP